MRYKKIPSTKLRSEIVVDNIFEYLAKKNLKQKDLAEVCSVSPSDVSKWKSYTTKINMDDLDKIADFLSVTIEDLFYSNEEKERGIPQLKGKVDPTTILAQRLIHVSVGAPNENCESGLLFINFAIVFIIFVFMKVFDIDLIYNFVFAILYVILMIIFKKGMARDETFVVNYMSDVFYKIENKKNQFYIYDLITKIVSSILSIALFLFVGYALIDGPNEFVLSVFIPIIIHTVITIINLIDIKKEYKEEIYHWEFTSYNKKYNSLIASTILGAMFIALVIVCSFPFFFLIIALIDFSMRVIEFILGSRKSREYKLAIMDEKKNINYLNEIINNQFPK